MNTPTSDSRLVVTWSIMRNYFTSHCAPVHHKQLSLKVFSIVFETPRLPNEDTSEKARLCIARAVQAIAVRGCGRAFHTNRSVCTGLFPLPVKVVGNLGRFLPPAASFSKSPHLHSSVLEN